jgi:DNA-directed RNA polymerase beta subunit
MIGDYDINDACVDKDVRILAVIPKFKTNFGSRQITENPMWTVIYADDKNKSLGCFHVKKYTDLDSGFGYQNVLINRALLKPETPVDKGTRFTRAPCHTETGYNMGVDLNVLFSTEFGATEDAVIISERAKAMMAHLSIKSEEITITEKDIPLNLHGNDGEFKAMPDIGERVKNDCLLIGFREHNPLTMLSDLTSNALQAPNYMYDKLRYATNSGAEVIDIQVFINPKIIRNLRKEDNVYNQFVKYQDQHLQYYRSVVNVYRDYVLKNHYMCEDMFNTLVMRCIGFLEPFEKPNSKMKPSHFKEDIDFIHIKITYAYMTEMNLGRKLTGRDGAKGVISAIWKNEDMPVDAHGRRADLIISPESGFNRMNPSQFYEQYLNRLSDRVAEDMTRMDDDDAYKYLMGYLQDVRPAYREYVESRVKTPALTGTFASMSSS